jgi:type II secretory pathway component PulF
MSLVLTPGQLEERSDLYHQLASLTSAGVTLPKALELLHRNPPRRSLRPLLAGLLMNLNEGESLGGSLLRLHRWIPSFDIALLQAGERSGRLDACFSLLAHYYRERASLARSVIADLLYPLFVLHFAILLLPVSSLVALVREGAVVPFLLQKLLVLGPLYGGVLLLVFACQGQHGEKWRAIIESVIGAIPILGTARRSLALARLAAALEALFNAGVNVINAWEMAATSSGSPALRREVFSWRTDIENGVTPAEKLRDAAEFPEIFANLYHTGEVSGKLDDSLLHLRAYYQDEGSRKLKLVAQWTPRLIYLLIMFGIAFQIISFYSGYFNQINQVME